MKHFTRLWNRAGNLLLTLFLLLIFGSQSWGQSNVIISEVCDASSYSAEFVELYNAGDASEDLADWQIKQYGSNQTTTFSSTITTNMTGNYTLAPGEYVVIFRGSLTEFKNLYSDFNGNYFTTNSTGSGAPQMNGSEYFELINSSSTIVDFFGSSSSKTAKSKTYERVDALTNGQNISTDWVTKQNSESTPGLVNSTSLLNDNSGGSSPSISLTSPTGGENWDAGTNQNITWSSTSIEKVDIEYHNGTDYTLIVDDATAADGSYTWAIPANLSGTTFKVRISDDHTNASISDESTNAFSIVKNPVLNIWTGNVDPTLLDGFSYLEGNGPSSSQIISIEGSNLTANVNVTASANYEISEDDANFSSSITIEQGGGSIALTSIYVRLKADLAANSSYSGDIEFTSDDLADTEFITCEGSVTCPTLTTPTATEATNVNSIVFTANWDAIANADKYYLDVYTVEEGGPSFTETFTSIGGGSASSYATRTWTGDNGTIWTAYNSRTDQAINTNDDAICLQNASGSYLISETISGGISQLSFDVSQAYSGSGGELTVKILYGESFATELEVGKISYSSSTSQFSKAINGITGDYKIRIDNNSAARAIIDNLTYGGGSTKTYVTNFENKEVSGTSAEVTGLTNETTYKYVVRAYSTCGATSTTENSNEIEVTTFTADSEAPVATFAPENNANDVVLNATPTLTFNEGLLKADGTAFGADEDVSSLISFYETATPANTVSFTATINGQVISIVPASDLKFSTEYTLSINANSVEDAAGNENSAAAINFTTINPVSIDFAVDMSVQAYKNGWDPTGAVIDVKGNFYKTESLTLSDADGDLVYSGTISNQVPGETYTFRFRKNGDSDKESADRSITLTTGANSVKVFYNDELPAEEANFLTFKIPGQAAEAQIKPQDASILVSMLSGTDVTALTPEFVLSPGAQLSPTLDATLNFTNDVKYTVASYGKTVVKDWMVHVEVLPEPSKEAEITAFSFTEQTKSANIDSDKALITAEVKWSADLTNLVPSIEISGGAQVSPTTNVAQDFSSPVVYTVTAEDNKTTKKWTVNVSKQEVAQVDLFVDMQKQINLGNFDPATDKVYVTGNFNNFEKKECSSKDNRIYGAAAQNQVVGTSVEFKFMINTDTELEGQPSRTAEVVSGDSQVEVWYNNVALGTEALIGSAYYPVYDAENKIQDIPYGTDLATFKANIYAENYGSFEVYKNETNVATDLATGYFVKVTSEDGQNEKKYDIFIDVERVEGVLTVDMQKQINLGNFDPATDKVNIHGNFTMDQLEECTTEDNRFYTYTFSGWSIESEIQYKFAINSTDELMGEDLRRITPVSGKNESTVWFNNLPLATEAILSSTVYTIDNSNEIITDIPLGTSLADFKANLSAENYGTFEVYSETGVVATNLATGYLATVSSEDEKTEKTYTITLDEPKPAKLIISQYYEGTSYNKWIEVTNIGDETATLDGYYIGTWSNTDDPTGSAHKYGELYGTLAPGASYLAMNYKAISPAYAVDETLANDAIQFNGDDAVAITKGSKNWEDRIDCIYSTISEGRWGENLSFVRKADVAEGNLNMSDLTEDGEWITITLDEVETALENTNNYLGFHAYEKDQTLPVAEFTPANNSTDINITTTVSLTLSEKVYKADGSEFTEGEDVSALLSFTETANSANTVSFTASISEKVITLTPAANLAYNTEFTVTLLANSVKDKASNYNLAQSTSFTTVAELTPIVEITSPAGSEVFYAGDQITLNWTSANITNVRAELYVEKDDQWIEVLASTDASTGTAQITLGADLSYSAAYKLRIADASNNTVNDASEAFEIIAVVADLATLRKQSAGDKVKLTGESIITWTQSFRSQKFIQDETAAILIDDEKGNITREYTIGDKISGFEGQLSEYYNMLQFIPSTDAGEAISSGNEVAAKAVTMEEFTTNFDAYEAQLITLSEVSFKEADGEKAFANGTAYTLSNGTIEAGFYTNFYGVDYIKSLLPRSKGTVTGIALARSQGNYVAAREASELVFKSYIATLSSITLDDKALDGFDANTFEYNVTLPHGTENIPFVAATLTDDKADLNTTQATALPGEARIEVTAEDGVTIQTYTISFELEPSTDATLASISVNNEALLDFAADKFTYDVVLPSGTTTAPIVTAKATDVNAIAVVTNATELPGLAIIEVTAEDGKAKLTYTLNFTVAENTDASLASIALDNEPMANFSADQLEYTIVLPRGTEKAPVVSAVANDKNAKVETSQAANAESKATIKVTAADGKTILTYSIAFEVEKNTDATLASITVNEVALSDFTTDKFTYAVELPYGTTDLPVVKAIATDENAKVEYNQVTELPATATITVTAEDGKTTQDYSIEFTVAPNTDATLASITVNEVALSDFATDKFTYAVELPYGTTDMPVVKATATDENAKVEYSQVTELPATATITVTAEDDKTTQDYTIEFTVAKNNDATLASISVNNQAIANFNADELEYNIELPFDAELPKVSAEASDAKAKVEITQVSELPSTAIIKVTAEDGATSLTYKVNFTLSKEVYTVKFIVKDEHNNLLADAKVDFNGESVYSDENGEAEFANVEPGNDLPYRASKDGHIAIEKTLDLENGNLEIDILLITVSVEDELSLNVNLYPNPTKGEATLSFNKLTNQTTIIVSNMEGKLIEQISTMAKEVKIDLSQKEAGVYFIRIVSGNTTHIEKLIVQ